MTSYTNTFTGNPVQSTPTSYILLTIAANTTLSWALNNEDTGDVVGDLTEVNATAGSLSLLMPPANQVSTGKATLIRNIGANSFTVKDNSGNTIQAIAAGQVFWIYISDNSSVNGTWKSFQFGTGTSSADANALAGSGLYASVSTLNLEFECNDFASNTTLTTSYRATVANWTGGAGTFAFSSVSTLTDGWFVLIKNSGTGALTLNPDGSETIDGVSTINLDPEESCIVCCTGSLLLTIGRNSSTTSATFTRLVKSVAGGTDVTLTSAEAAYDIQEYTGLLTANINVIVPTAVARWWVYNNTSGAYTLTVKTSAGTGIAIAQGTRQIIHCDGTNAVLSVDAGTGTVSNIATGTGLSGGPITTTGTISIANTAVTAGTYGGAIGVHSTTFNAQGQATAASFTARSVTGTANRISVTDGDGVAGAPTIDISATYVGQSSITTLGTITTGVWNGTPIGVTYGGTGQSTFPYTISGYIPSSMSGTSTTASMTISEGRVTSSTNAYIITKLTSSSWAVSNGNAALGYQGGTTLPSNDTIHFFACYGGSGTTIFAHNGLTPTPPAGYDTYYGYVGSFNTNSSGAPIAYVARELSGGAIICLLAARVADLIAVSLGTSSRTTLTLASVPTDIRVAPLFDAYINNNPNYSLITSLDEPDTAVSVSSKVDANMENDGFTLSSSLGNRLYMTNTLGQIAGRSNSSGTAITLTTYGWINYRR